MNRKGDNICDDGNNNCGCEWDGGDCCGSNVNKQKCVVCECREITSPSYSFDFLRIHNGGSDDSEIVANLTGRKVDEITISGNQMFVVFNTNHVFVRKGFQAMIIESKYTQIAIEQGVRQTTFVH